METQSRERIVVSVGGSLIVPDQIDIAFLSQFKKLIEAKVKAGFSFTIIAGGGKTARRYQEAAKAVTSLSFQDLDWLGIHACRINAHLLRTIFRDIAYPRVIKNPTLDIETESPVVILTGWKPGYSSDYVATLAAKNIGARKLVNLTNIDHVYDKDPKKNPDARQILKISWPNFRKLIPAEWDPGLSAPFDPMAAKEAEQLGLEVAIMNGEKLEEFSNYLDGKAFVGTIIS